MKTIAGMVAVLMLAACGGSDDEVGRTTTGAAPLRVVPPADCGPVYGLEARDAPCCEAGAEWDTRTGTCFVRVLVCGGVDAYRMIPTAAEPTWLAVGDSAINAECR